MTTVPSVRSAVGTYTRTLLAHLDELLAVEVFVEPELAGAPYDGRPTRSAGKLDPRAFDHVLYQLGDEAEHAFMLPLIARHGGTVVQHDWALVELARAAFPALARGGLRGRLTALRLGGLRAATSYGRGGLELPRESTELALNRAVVRRGDAYIVHDDSLRVRILEERNAATPIGVVSYPATEADWADLARGYVTLLERFPAHRSNRKSLIRSAIESADQARAARRTDRPEGQ